MGGMWLTIIYGPRSRPGPNIENPRRGLRLGTQRQLAVDRSEHKFVLYVWNQSGVSAVGPLVPVAAMYTHLVAQSPPASRCAGQLLVLGAHDCQSWGWAYIVVG